METADVFLSDAAAYARQRLLRAHIVGAWGVLGVACLAALSANGALEVSAALLVLAVLTIVMSALRVVDDWADRGLDAVRHPERVMATSPYAHAFGALSMGLLVVVAYLVPAGGATKSWLVGYLLVMALVYLTTLHVAGGPARRLREACVIAKYPLLVVVPVSLVLPPAQQFALGPLGWGLVFSLMAVVAVMEWRPVLGLREENGSKTGDSA